MNPTDLLMPALVLSGLAAWSVVLWRAGVQRGKDEQRVDDILEMWAKVPDRDARGRFKRRGTNL